MCELWKSFKSASPEIKMFVLTCATLVVILIITLVYTYGRLNYDRSYSPSSQKEQTT